MMVDTETAPWVHVSARVAEPTQLERQAPPLTGWCVECGATTAGGNGSPLHEALCADCAEAQEEAREAAEERAAERYSQEDATMRAERQHAVCAAYLGDWRRF